MMDAYERSIIRGIYESACMGSRAAMRILENLTTKRRRRGNCQTCGGKLPKRAKKFCTVLCANRAPRTNFTKGPKPKLTEEQIAAIKLEYVPGANSSALAKKYGVSPGTIIRWATGRKKPSKTVKLTALDC